MNKYEKMWAPIYEEFENYYPYLAEHVVDWYPSGQMEITVRLDNGEKKCFDWMEKIIYNAYSPIREAEDNVSEDDWRDEFALRLHRKMRKFGVNIESLSERSGISKVTLSKYLNGRATPSTYNLYILARILHCSPNELMPILHD